MDINPNKLERKTALVARELQRQGINISYFARNTSCRVKVNSNREKATTPSFGKVLKNSQDDMMWDSQSKTVGFTIKNSLIGNLVELPNGVNERLICLLIQ